DIARPARAKARSTAQLSSCVANVRKDRREGVCNRCATDGSGSCIDDIDPISVLHASDGCCFPIVYSYVKIGRNRTRCRCRTRYRRRYREHVGTPWSNAACFAHIVTTADYKVLQGSILEVFLVYLHTTYF